MTTVNVQMTKEQMNTYRKTAIIVGILFFLPHYGTYQSCDDALHV
jgi:hypothetical protein